MIILQYWIFTSEIDIIEWDWKKFKPYLFTNNGYCQLLMLCCHCLPCVSPFHKNLRSHILVPSPYLPGIFTSDIPGPLHEEVLSESPSIVMFHDFLTSEEIKFMKNTIMSQMKVISYLQGVKLKYNTLHEVATVQDVSKPNGGGIKISSERTQVGISQ